MKDFPTIPHRTGADIDADWYMFDKLDGSNIRAEWNPKKGFYKHGSRTQLISTESGVLNEAPAIIEAKYGDDLGRIFRAKKYESAVAFFEFWGPSSFAGAHAAEPHTVTLFDVSPYKRGILPPDEFLSLFGGLDVPAMLHRGPIDFSILNDVEQGDYPGVTFEGVVCKAKADRKTTVPTMFKVKSFSWLERLREKCAGDDRLFERLR